MTKSTVTKSQSTVYKIRVKEPHSTWADITINENSGAVDIQSDYGNYSYMWNCIGDRTLRDFLISLDYQYFMGKAAANNGYKFSLKESIKLIKQEIVESRKLEDTTKEEARECWDDLSEIEEYSSGETSYFEAVCRTTNLFATIFGEDFHGVPSADEHCPSAKGFWDIFWPVACGVWKEELSLEKAVG